MNSLDSPLTAIYTVYVNLKDSLKVLRRVNEGKDQDEIERLLKRTKFSSTTPELITIASDESEASLNELFTLALWAAFEKWLRDYLQAKCDCLGKQHPADLTEKLQSFLRREALYWKNVDMLDMLKGVVPPDVAGNAKNIIAFRDWVAHGKGQHKPPPAQIDPRAAHELLSEIIKHVQSEEAALP